MSESPPNSRPLSRRTVLRGVAGVGALGAGGATVVAGDGDGPEPVRIRSPESDSDPDDDDRSQHVTECDDVTDAVLREAIVDWAMGDLSDDQLTSVIVCWARDGTDDPDYR